jgi:hypothetical protein
VKCGARRPAFLDLLGKGDPYYIIIIAWTNELAYYVEREGIVVDVAYITLSRVYAGYP